LREEPEARADEGGEIGELVAGPRPAAVSAQEHSQPAWKREEGQQMKKERRTKKREGRRASFGAVGVGWQKPLH